MQVLDNFLFRCWQMGWLKNDFHQLEKENAELKSQIEKMKCCGNCKHYIYDCGERYCKYDATREKDCENRNQWELAE